LLRKLGTATALLLDSGGGGCAGHEANADGQFDDRFLVLPSAGMCISAAHTESDSAQLIAVGCDNGALCFVDLSLANQQVHRKHLLLRLGRGWLLRALGVVS
jgi:hypothetical protein